MIQEKQIEIHIKTLAPLRIGGRDDPLTGMENAVARIGSQLVIPGPSLKGALRHQIERYLIDTYYEAQNRRWPREHLSLQPCMASAGKVSSEEAALIAAGKFRKTEGRQGEVRSGCAYQGGAKVCPACYLLGAQGLVGFVRVPFLILKSDQASAALYSGRIDRATGTISQGTNRPYELVPAGTAFGGTLTVLLSDDLRGWKLGQPRWLEGDRQGTPDPWLESGEWNAERIIEELIVQRLKAIQGLGGYRSKGFGQVQVDVKA